MTKQRAALLSVVSNSLLILLKIFAGILMGSISVISEAVHSAIDLIASIVAYFSIKKANEPADKDHPFGHGKFENISGFFEAMLIFFAAAMIVYEAVKKLFHPIEVEQLWWGIAVMLVSVLVNIFVSRMLFKTAKKSNSIALEADAMHLWVDVFTSVSVLTGLAIIKITHVEILDPIIAIVVACMIGKASWDLTKKSLRDLADQSLPEEELKIICGILSSYPEITGHHKLRTRKSGDRREIDLHVTMEKKMTLEAAHEVCFKIENTIKQSLPGSYITLHVEPDERKGK